jgi:ankyrin repeat protein
MKKIRIYGLVSLLVTMAAQAVFADNAALMNAIRLENEAMLAAELNNNWVTSRNALINGKTALMLAVEKGWRRGVEMLLNKQADPNVKGNGGETALLLAARTNPDAEIIKLLLNNNANISVKDDAGNTVLMYAVQNDIPVTLNFLLNRPDISPSQVNDAGENALMIAVRGRKAGAQTALLQKNLDLLHVNRDGEDALYIAVQEENLDAVQRLLKKNVRSSFNRSTNNNRTVMMAAVETGNVDLVRALLDTGYVDMMRVLPAQGSSGPLPLLLWAINTNKSQAIITEIIEYYSDFLDEMVDREGRNAWYYADLRRQPAIKRRLEQKGITVQNAQNTQY